MARPIGTAGSGAGELPGPGGMNTTAKLAVPPTPEKRASPVVAWSARREPGTARAAAANSRAASVTGAGPAAATGGRVAVSTTGGFWKPPL
jgi:hypothetical protein